MIYENILTQTLSEGITLITLNRPTKLNALNKNTIQELHNALHTALQQHEIKVIIITGSGEKAFVAGADIAEFANFSEDQGQLLAAQGQEMLFDYIQNFPKPIIAAVNGFALGGGLELAMACHFRIASTNARMGLPEVTLGVIPGYGGTQRLPQLVGKGKAMEMILTADMITADDALTHGLVNYVVPQPELLPFTESIAKKMLKNSPKAISQAIKTINDGFAEGVNGYQSEIKAFGECFGTEDFKEGTTAFLEKRKANFTGK